MCTKPPNCPIRGLFRVAPGRARRPGGARPLWALVTGISVAPIMRFPHNTGQGAGLEIGDEWPRAMVERGGVAHERLRACQNAPCAGTHKPAPYASTLRALFVNRRMPNGTYGGVRGGAGDDPSLLDHGMGFRRSTDNDTGRGILRNERRRDRCERTLLSSSGRAIRRGGPLSRYRLPGSSSAGASRSTKRFASNPRFRVRRPEDRASSIGLPHQPSTINHHP